MKSLLIAFCTSVNRNSSAVPVVSSRSLGEIISGLGSDGFVRYGFWERAASRAGRVSGLVMR